MAFTVQDNTGGVAGANAYISVAEFKAYHDDRGASLYGAATDQAIQMAIVKATDYLDTRFSFIGEKAQTGQTTEWPRFDAWDREDEPVYGVPAEVKEACAEYALRALTAQINPDPTLDPTGRVVLSKSEQVGPISQSVSYAAGAAFEMPRYPVADRKLTMRGLTRSRASRDLARA